MADKNYLGNGWKRTFDNGGTIINLSVNLEKLQKLPLDNYGNVQIVVGELKTPGKAKQTHSVYENDYKKNQSQPQNKPEPTYNEPPQLENENLNW